MDEQLKEIQENYGIYEGLQADLLDRIHDVSSYNYNYYFGLKREGVPRKDLLFGEADDDDTIIWYVVHNCHFTQIGYSSIGEGNYIHLGTLI